MMPPRCHLEIMSLGFDLQFSENRPQVTGVRVEAVPRNSDSDELRCVSAL